MMRRVYTTELAIATIFALTLGCTSPQLFRLGKELKNGSRSERVVAAAELGSLDESGAIPTLLGALDDEDEAVRNAVATALGKKGSAAVGYLVKVLRSGAPNARMAAADALGKIGSPSYDDVLTLVNSESNPEIQSAAIRALGTIEDPRAIPILLERLSDSDLVIRRSVIQALGHFNDPRIFEALFPLLDDSQVVDLVGRSLGRSGALQVKRLADGLTDRPLAVRLTLFDALGQTRSREALPVLVEQLRLSTKSGWQPSPDDEKLTKTLENAISSLGPDVVAPLVERLRADESGPWQDGWLFSSIAVALASVVDESTLQLLIDEVQSQRSLMSAKYCTDALLAVTEQKDEDGNPTNLVAIAERTIQEAFRSENENVRRMVGAQSNYYKAEQPTPWMRQQLMSALERRDLAVVGAAYEFYIRRGIPGSEEVLAAAMLEADSGSTMMAEGYINSGNPTLAQAAREWARRHGWSVKSADRPVYLNWGVNR